MECINTIYKSKTDLLPIVSRAKHYNSNQVLIQVFCGVEDVDTASEVLSEIKALFPDVPIIGTSTEGEILGSEVTDNEIVVSVSLFENSTVRTVYSDEPDLSMRGRILRSEVEKFSPKVAIIFTTSIEHGKFVNNADLIGSLTTGNKEVVFCGGQAGIDKNLSDTFIFSDQAMLRKGTVVAMLEGKQLSAWRFRNDGWLPIGRKMQVTKSDGFRIHEIDNKSVRELYRHYLGVELDLSNLQHPAIQFPLMCERSGVLVKNVPTHDYGDGSYDFTTRLSIGESVRFSFCDISNLEQEVSRIKNAVESRCPESLFIYSCGGRKQLLKKLIDIDTQGLEEITSTAGLFTSTEFFTASDMRTHSLVQNMTLLGLSEHETICERRAEEPTVIPDNSASGFNIIRILTKLISQTSKELEESNSKLLEMVKLDNMTGLYNRNHFDHVLNQELKRHHRSKQPLSLILLDIDYFKQFNDVYGHVSGDNCLAEVGSIIKDTLKRPADLAFRYGGEEMGALLVNTDLVGVEHIAESIRSRIENAAIPHAASNVSSYVTASFGFITVYFESKEVPTAQQFIEFCDTLLYQAKKHGRNQCVGKIIEL